MEVDVDGAFSPATRWQPEERPEVDYAMPSACLHDAPENEENVAIVGGRYTLMERATLIGAIEDAALAAHEATQYDPAWDGPDEDDR